MEPLLHKKAKKKFKQAVFDSYAVFFGKPVWRKLNTFLFDLSLRGLGILNHKGSRLSGEAYLIENILPKLIENERPTIFDVGANQGNYSELLAQSFPTAKIYAFEPHPKSFENLSRLNTENLQLFNIALGDSPGELTLYDLEDMSGSVHASFYKEIFTEIRKMDTVHYSVPVDTLDQFAKKTGIDFIDFIKVDTEGNDLAIFKGATDLLVQKKIGCIQFEFNEMNVVSRVFFRDFRRIFSEYTLFRLLPNALLRLTDQPLTTEIFAYQNILAIPNEKTHHLEDFL